MKITCLPGLALFACMTAGAQVNSYTVTTIIDDSQDPFLINPWGDLLSGKDYRGITKRRIDILHERLGFERERIHEWGVAHAVLSAWWSIEDHGDWHYALAFAEMIADLDIK